MTGGIPRAVVGAVYEFPLTDDSKGMMENRLMVDAMFTLRF